MKRRKWDPKTKAMIVIQGLKGKSVGEICLEHQISQAQYYQWRDQFLANAHEVFTGNEKKGNITLGMRTGRMVSRKNGGDQYVADTFYISGIPRVYEIEQICRKRIKENDPTPPTSE